jgi:hypothetical protein
MRHSPLREHAAWTTRPLVSAAGREQGLLDHHDGDCLAVISNVEQRICARCASRRHPCVRSQYLRDTHPHVLHDLTLENLLPYCSRIWEVARAGVISSTLDALAGVQIGAVLHVDLHAFLSLRQANKFMVLAHAIILTSSKST